MLLQLFHVEPRSEKPYEPSFKVLCRLKVRKVSDSMQVPNWNLSVCELKWRPLSKYCNVAPSAVPIAQQKDSVMHLTGGFLHVYNHGIERETCANYVNHLVVYVAP